MVLALIFSYVKIQKRLLQFRSSIAFWNLILKNKINIQLNISLNSLLFQLSPEVSLAVSPRLDQATRPQL